jgi:hypothetical protein
MPIRVVLCVAIDVDADLSYAQVVAREDTDGQRYALFDPSPCRKEGS